MKRLLLLFAITFMVIGQTLSARDWTVPSGSSSTEAVFYVTLQDKDGNNVAPLADGFELGAFVDGVCRGLGTTSSSTETTVSESVFVFRIPVTSADAGKAVSFALRIDGDTEYTLSEVSGSSAITLTGGDQTVGYPSGSHKLLFTAPTNVKATGDGIITMDVYDTVTLSDVLVFEPEGANVPDNYNVSVGNYGVYMKVENGELTALKPNQPAEFNQNISVSFKSNTTASPVFIEIPVAINNPIASITLKDGSANTLTVPVNDSETTSKLAALINVAGKYAEAEYTGQVIWTLKTGDATGIEIVEGSTQVTPTKVGEYVLTANNEDGNLTGVDITLTVIQLANRLVAIYPNGITVVQGSQMNEYLEHLYEIDPADATHGKSTVTYTFSGTTNDGSEIFSTLDYTGLGKVTTAVNIGSGTITVKHPDIELPLSIPVNVIKGVPGPKEGVLEPLSISVPKEQLNVLDITDDLKSHVATYSKQQWDWSEFTWESSVTTVVKPAVTTAGFIAAGYGTTTLSGSKTVTACGFNDEGTFVAELEQTGNLMIDVTIVQGLSGISIKGFTIGCEDKDQILTVTTDPAGILLEDAEISFGIPSLSDQTPILSLERVEGTNTWKVTPDYPGSGALTVTYGDFNDEATVTVSQHLTLAEGWSWISTYAGAISLGADNAGNILEARSQTALTYNDPVYGFFGDLNTLDGTSAYKVNVKTGVTFDYTADNASLYTNDATTVTLQPGWNWVNNPCAKNHSFDEIFSKAELPENSSVVALTGFMAYANGQWSGSLESINAGEGYLIYNPGTENISFVIQPDRMMSEYVASGEAGTTTARTLMANTRVDRTVLTYNPRRFADNMSIIASLPEGVDSERYTVVPFVGDECRGESKLDNDRFFITVHGQKGEQVSFRLFDNQTGEYENSLVEMPFSMMEGSIKAPVVLGTSTTAIDTITIDQNNQDGSEPVIYDMQGRRMSKDARGLLIINGEKVFVK